MRFAPSPAKPRSLNGSAHLKAFLPEGRLHAAVRLSRPVSGAGWVHGIF